MKPIFYQRKEILGKKKETNISFPHSPCFPLTDTILPLRNETVRALARVVTKCVTAFRARVTLVYVVKALIYREQIQKLHCT